MAALELARELRSPSEAHACKEGFHCREAADDLVATDPVTGKPVASRRFGTIFAVRWGQWSQYGRGQATAWVTTRPRPFDRRTIIREFNVAELPTGIVAPAGVKTVYAIALEQGEREQCTRCEPDQQSRGVLFGPSDCVCALRR